MLNPFLACVLIDYVSFSNVVTQGYNRDMQHDLNVIGYPGLRLLLIAALHSCLAKTTCWLHM